ncbi:hypothetical protein [Rickettsia endosymbiont of Gonocerus acuteangulatus]|uniref:hypothetical protein n=1 Tax=Rickettsia endosymbiont of Gonocerus acuteangulatus TaxID=3066266 RepID=UPI003132FCE6
MKAAQELILTPNLLNIEILNLILFSSSFSNIGNNFDSYGSLTSNNLEEHSKCTPERIAIPLLHLISTIAGR